MEEVKLYNLYDNNGKLYKSNIPGLFGEHKKLKIYGELNCPSALRHLEKGQYVKYKNFF